MPHVHWEVKRTEKLRLENALEQSKRDAGEDEFALVAHKKNRSKWIVIMDMDEFMEIYKAWERSLRNENDG